MSTDDKKNVDGENVNLTAYALGELSEAEMANLAMELEGSPEMRAELDETRAMAEALGAALGAEPEMELSSAQRAAIIGSRSDQSKSNTVESSRQAVRRYVMRGALVAAALTLVVAGLQIFNQGKEIDGTNLRYQFPFDLDGTKKPTAIDPTSEFVYRPSPKKEQLGDLGYSDHPGISLIDLNGFGGGSGYHTWRDTSVLQVTPTEQSTEAYAYIEENKFRSVANEPLSTFSIDVDTASYAIVRRFLTSGQLPPVDAVRIEELINYFSYDYPAPTGGDPFSVNVEVTSAPWRETNRLVRIGLRGKDIAFEARRPTNLVFLLDVSGSMNSSDKLPLVKKSLRLLVDQLENTDHVAIAVYAGAAGMILPPTSGNSRGAILQAMERLEAGGSTNGGQSIQLAYSMARQNLDPEGVNRVILCTDGDFNVGMSGEGDLVRLVKEQARDGIELSVLGFGTGNLKDSTMEQMADHGNGNYSYIDSLREAHKVLVEEMGGTLVTIAKDVKIQVEFNPLEVAAYRLIGYENRLLANEDFNDDRVDAGEIGSGHTVTALYEVVPAGADSKERSVDPLKYGQAQEPSAAAGHGELLTVKLRYKQPKGSKSALIEQAVRDNGLSFADASNDTRFAASVAEFGMLLRGSKHGGAKKIQAVLRRAVGGLGSDPGGYRTEFVQLITRAIALGLAGESRDGIEEEIRQLEEIGYVDER